MLEVAGLTVAYGPHRALEDVTISVDRGEICVILGANGAGKSTLLKAIAGTIRARPGAKMMMDRRDISRERPNRVVEAGLALVPEGRGIFGDLTVAENLELGAYGKRARKVEKERLAQVYELFPRLGERRRQVARTMSGGEQQMVAIGRALMSNPAILMLDEPSLGFSPLLTRDLFRSLRAIRESGVGILLVEQNAKQSLAIADRGYLLENGHITGQDSAGRLANDPAVQAAYLGGAVSGRAPKAIAAPAPIALGSAAANRSETIVASADRPRFEMASALAAHAAEVHRNHVNRMRAGLPGTAATLDGETGHASALPAPAGPARPLAGSADALSRQAGELARRAQEIQARHLADIRSKTSIWTLLSRSASLQAGKS